MERNILDEKSILKMTELSDAEEDPLLLDTDEKELPKELPTQRLGVGVILDDAEVHKNQDPDDALVKEIVDQTENTSKSSIAPPTDLRRSPAATGPSRRVPGAVHIPPSRSTRRQQEPAPTTSTIASGSADAPASVDIQTNSTVVSAFKVEEDHAQTMEQALKLAKNQLLQEAIQASTVEVVSQETIGGGSKEFHGEKTVDPNPSTGRPKKWMLFVLPLVLLVLALVLGLSLRSNNNNSNENNIENIDKEDSQTMPPTEQETEDVAIDDRPTLERVLEQGYLVCGIASGFLDYSVDEVDAFTIRICRAISGALFGSPDHVEYRASPNRDRWELIHNRTIDVTINLDTMTMERDVYLSSLGFGVDFTIPYAHGGAVVDGIATYVDCVDNQDSFFGVCRDLVICGRSGGTTEAAALKEALPGAPLILIPWNTSLPQAVAEGECNVAVQMGLVASEEPYRRHGLEEEYALGKNVFSRDPLAMITRSNDSKWRDLCNWVLQGLFWAEALGVEIDNLRDMVPSVIPFGDISINYTAAVESAGGNYGKGVYDVPHLINGEIRFPGRERIGLNALNLNGTTGLLYSSRLGTLDVIGPGATPGGTMDKILQRGHLTCGVVVQAGGFASYNETSDTWEGFDVEWCHVTSAALFRVGSPEDEALEIVGLSDDDCFTSLANGDIDLLAGGPASYETDVLEPTSGVGFTLSMPYFYGDIDFQTGVGDVRTILTREGDSQWSDFCYWVINALIYAEEQGITKTTAVEMPVVSLFGESMKQMFRDAVFSGGNYGEIYSQSLEWSLPRGGRNQLNSNPVGPEQFPLPFKFSGF